MGRVSAISGRVITSSSHSVDLSFFGWCQNFQDGTSSSGTSPVLRIWSRELRATESKGWMRPLSSTGSRPNSRT